MKDPYLTTQIITYMGNKRKLLHYIDAIIEQVKTELNTKSIDIGEGFSGSGIVSRLFKQHAKNLYVNDIAGYSETLNKCYLASPDSRTINKIKKYLNEANNLKETNIPWISTHWSPNSETIMKNERAYYTKENAKIIDKIRHYINSLPQKYQHFLLAPLLVESSIHNNTNGQFASYYKDENNIGCYGGKKYIDLQRITKNIKIEMPIFLNNDCKVNISCDDATQWACNIPELDLVYYDPPYNKHPYNIYYFMLDIINDWDLNLEIPNTYRGQPKNWISSEYNSMTKAKKALTKLIQNTNSKYILLSYNNGGIIPIETIDKILRNYGNVTKIPIEHKTYNRMKGISNYKRKKPDVEIKEFLWLVKKKLI